MTAGPAAGIVSAQRIRALPGGSRKEYTALSKHAPIIEIGGLNDPGPLLSLRTVCLCGAIIAERHYDMRGFPEGVELEYAEHGDEDARAFLDHVEALS